MKVSYENLTIRNSIVCEKAQSSVSPNLAILLLVCCQSEFSVVDNYEGIKQKISQDIFLFRNIFVGKLFANFKVLERKVIVPSCILFFASSKIFI